jgi:diguanylate cyclase (GGDEF)-like protein/PAS domain S-box-containing protein
MVETSAKTAHVALIVDDDPTIRLIARRTLESAGFETLVAVDGESGLEAFHRQRPDIVLMDVMLPGMDGYEAVAALRRDPHGTHVPVLMLTGLDDLESINRAYEAGATDFISKPINWGILGHRVRYILRAAEAFEAVVENQALLSSAQRVARLGSWRWDLVSAQTRWSEETFRILGYEPGEIEPSRAAMLQRVHPEELGEVRAVLASLEESRPVRELIHRVVRPDGTLRYVRIHADVVPGPDGSPQQVYGAIQDVTETKEAEARIHQLAYFDRLTQLPNRVSLLEHLESALQEAGATGRRFAVLSLDLDQFKRINDTFSHGVGDTLLSAVAERLRGICRTPGRPARGLDPEELPLARLGGDEFCLLVRDAAQFEDAAKWARRLLDALQRPFDLDGQEMFITASIGISLFPVDGQDADTLMKNADAAMYFAKSQGRNNYRFYDREMNSRALERLALESRLRRAVERGDFELRYQPKLDLRSGQLVGAEALIRWPHPELGLVSPEEFIPVAEDSGLIVAIGEWALSKAAAQLRAWGDAGMPSVHVSVNIASPHFQQPGFTAQVAEILQRTGVDPHLLELEVTESMLVDDRAQNLLTLHALKALGLRLSIDDFGTGYSSLSYLKRFPVDTLKVDRSFIKDTPAQEDDAAITSAIIAMAHSLRLEVVAEGVETPAQLAFLRARGCEYVQGYLISKPVSAEEFAALLKREPAILQSLAAA